MKEMEYKNEISRELLAKGEYLGYKYYILSLGTHPTAYVEIPKDEKHSSEEIEALEVHGGITYNENILNIGEKAIKGWFIGWDYAHYGDYTGIYTQIIGFNDLKKWTTQEIQEEAYKVIEQLKKTLDK